MRNITRLHAAVWCHPRGDMAVGLSQNGDVNTMLSDKISTVASDTEAAFRSHEYGECVYLLLELAILLRAI